MSDPVSPVVSILTLGCKLNLADSEAMARDFRAAGWTVVDKPADTDAVIVNTCSVTHVADRKSRHVVRLARRLAPNATLSVTGCLLETAPAGILDALAADRVVRQPDQSSLVRELVARWPRLADDAPVLRGGLKTRSFVSAQEGCNDVCAFCIVPKTRGRERSRSIAAVVAEVNARVADGVREVVITGTQLGAYGRDSGEGGPAALLGALLAETDATRIRMSSLQPQDITPALVRLWEDPRLCRHLHLALQSGSETVLRRMRRRYTADQYREAVDCLRASIPGVAITTDVIAGFPGETDAEFEETYAFCDEMAFQDMHVFPYSVRSGTVAAKMTGQVADATKQARVRRLIDLAAAMTRASNQRQLGRTAAVLWEQARSDAAGSIWEGRTDDYLRVALRSEADLRNRITSVRLTALREDGVWSSEEVDG